MALTTLLLALLLQQAARLGLTIDVDQPLQPSLLLVRYDLISQREQASPAFQAYQRLLAQELAKYSPRSIRLSGLRSIALVSALSFDEQPRAGVPDYHKEILWLDALHSTQEPYLRHVIHHELFHLLIEQIKGDALALLPRWQSLNPSGFSYGSLQVPRHREFALSHPLPGLLNAYSASAAYEDQAEIYAALMLEPEARQLDLWSRSDPHLRAKRRAVICFAQGLDPALRRPWWPIVACDKE